MIVARSWGFVGVLGAIALTVSTGAAAHAFTFTQSSAFVLGTETHTVGPSQEDGIRYFGPAVSTTDGSAGLPAGFSTFSTIAWGNGLNAGVDGNIANAPSFTVMPGPGPNADKSGLLIVGNNGTINVGETVVLADIFHRNRVISGPTLLHVDIFSILNIFDGADLVLANTNNVAVDFNETSNSGTCNPATQISATPCDDFATFPLDSFASVGFSVGGQDYVLTFSANCLAGDPNTARCDFPDPNDPTRARIITAENNINHLQILMTLSLATVPAPPALVLMGLGLAAALAAARRRRD